MNWPGAMGGFGANHPLCQSLVFLDMPVLQQLQAYGGGAASLFDESGPFKDDGARSFIDAFAAWIEATKV